MSHPSLLLEHVTVLDLSQFLAGPFCTQILADLGATVIKVEPPDGDLSRSVPPHFLGEKSAYFCSTNRNKKSVVINLKSSRGRRIALRLAAQTDVVVENFRPGVMERMDISYARLREVNDKVILCSISGFGQDGPYRDRPAYDAIVQALAGTMSLTGEENREPVRMGVPLGDIAAGQYAATATLAAIVARDATGAGCHIDISMLDSQIAMLSYQAAYYLLSGEVPGTQGRGHVSIPTYRSFQCADGDDIIVTANTQRMWHGLCRVLDIEEIAADPMFATNERRLENRVALWSILESRFHAREAEDWLERLRVEEVPAARVNTVAEALADPQVSARRMVVEASDSRGRLMRLIGNPIKFLDHRPNASAHQYLAELGEHTEELLSSVLGMTSDEISSLAEDGIIGTGRPESCVTKPADQPSSKER